MVSSSQRRWRSSCLILLCRECDSADKMCPAIRLNYPAFCLLLKSIIMCLLIASAMTLLWRKPYTRLSDTSDVTAAAGQSTDLASVYAKRRETLRRFCAEGGAASVAALPVHPDNEASPILWIYPYNFTYCLVPKVASTFWLSMIVSAFPGTEAILRRIRGGYFHLRVRELMGLPQSYSNRDAMQVDKIRKCCSSRS